MNWIVFLDKCCFRKMDSTSKAMVFAPCSDAERVLLSGVSCNAIFFKLLLLLLLLLFFLIFVFSYVIS